MTLPLFLCTFPVREVRCGKPWGTKGTITQVYVPMSPHSSDITCCFTAYTSFTFSFPKFCWNKEHAHLEYGHVVRTVLVVMTEDVWPLHVQFVVCSKNEAMRQEEWPKLSGEGYKQHLEEHPYMSKVLHSHVVAFMSDVVVGHRGLNQNWNNEFVKLLFCYLCFT